MIRRTLALVHITSPARCPVIKLSDHHDDSFNIQSHFVVWKVLVVATGYIRCIVDLHGFKSTVVTVPAETMDMVLLPYSCQAGRISAGVLYSEGCHRCKVEHGRVQWPAHCQSDV
jgi:hypothetical protein